MPSGRILAKLLVAAGLASAGLAAACQGPVAGGPADGPPGLNATCPVMGGPVDPARTVVVDGVPVAFCCQECVVKWIALSPEEQAAALARVREADGR